MTTDKIGRASTPTGAFYLSEESWRRIEEHVFPKVWHYIGNRDTFSETGTLYPFTLAPGSLNEPLILSMQTEGHSVFSNVCTHRGYMLLKEKSNAQVLRCRYHGRCFHHNGAFMSMPEFESAENFPTRMDDLARAHHSCWNGLHFVSLFPEIALEEILQPVMDRLYWFPFYALKHYPTYSNSYTVEANWALYCDNYLEGFHIPYVHKSLNKVIDYSAYETIEFAHGNLQLGIARDVEPVFDIPAGAPDHGQRVAAYYYWIFPNLMLNFYPWGLSLNVVEPHGKDRTIVHFHVFISDHSIYDTGAGSDLHRVEMEDEEVVESVHRGLHARLYQSGRYSPKMERGVFQFHTLLRKAMYPEESK